MRGEVKRKGMKRRGSEKVKYGVNEGSCWCSLQPDEAEIWDSHNHRTERRERAERKKHKCEKERECPSKRKKAKYAGSKQSKPTKKCRWREENVEILTWEMKCSGANKVRVRVCVKEQWCGEERVMCLGRERKGKGVGEHALFGLSLDAGLAFLRHTQTHPGAVSTYHTPRDRKNMA